jgi:phage terminase large subunit
MMIPGAEPYTVTLTEEDGTIKTLYEPNSEAQVKFHQANQANVLMYGNRGGGKSHCGRWDAHIKALSTPGFKFCILRRTYPELQKTHLIHIRQEMKWLGGYFNKQEKIAYYPNGSTGFFTQCETEQDELKLLSAEYALMFFDELSTFPWEMFIKLATSCRVPKDSGLTAMVRGGTNPLGVSAEEIMHYFVDKDVDPEDDPDYLPEDWAAIKIQAEDNVNLDTKQYQKRFSGMPAHVRKAWVDGEFALENALFDIKPNIRVWDEDGVSSLMPYHYLDRLDVDEVVQKAEIYRAYDHGYFPDPALCLWIAHLGNRYVVFKEKLWFKTIAAEVARDMKEETLNMGIKRVVATYCDPTIDIHTGADVQTIKDVIENNGVPLEPSINSRELYAASIHQALAEEAGKDTPRLQIYTKGCPYLAKSLPRQRFDPKHPMKMANHKDDHAAVALAYFLISSGSMEKKTMSQQTLRPWLKQKKGESWVIGRENVRDYR